MIFRSKKEVGKFGEDFAKNYLKKLGWKILDTNFHYSRYAELDIVAKDGDTIVFVEVKTRSTTSFGHPFEVVNKTKLDNIFKAGLAWLNTTKESYKNYRIDVVSVLGQENPQVEHLKNVSLN